MTTTLFTPATANTVMAEACATLGLPADSAELIRFGKHAMWRLPGGIVLRIPPAGRHRIAAREITVARWLHDHAVPTVRPIADLPQPMDVRGHAVTFWHELPPHRHGTLADLAGLLRRLHELPLPDFYLPPVDPFERLVERIERAAPTPEDRAWLDDRLTDLQDAWHDLPPGLPDRFSHGEAWIGNVAVADGTATILDFEAASVGPPEWDLATTAYKQGIAGTHDPEAYRNFCRIYGFDVTTWVGYPVLRAVRELRIACLTLDQALHTPGLADEALLRLRCVQGRGGPRPWEWPTWRS